MQTIKLGELLVKANVLRENQLRAALTEQQKWGGRIGDMLVRMSLVTEDLLVLALSKQLAIPAVNLEAIAQIPDFLKAKIPLEMARDLEVVPIRLKEDGKTLVVAMAEPQNVEHADLIRARTGCRIMVQLAGRTGIARAITRFYGIGPDLSQSEVFSKGPNPEPEVERSSPQAETETPGKAHTGIPVLRGPADHAAELLRAVEDVQRKEVAALKAMVDLLLEKGVFSREEYLAKVRR